MGCDEGTFDGNGPDVSGCAGSAGPPLRGDEFLPAEANQCAGGRRLGSRHTTGEALDMLYPVDRSLESFYQWVRLDSWLRLAGTKRLRMQQIAKNLCRTLARGGRGTGTGSEAFDAP